MKRVMYGTVSALALMLAVTGGANAAGTDQAALDVHAKVNTTRAPLPEGLCVGDGEREDYEYNRVR